MAKQQDPNDIKDLSKSLATSVKEMAKMVKYSETFRTNICGAKDCLDEIAGKQKANNTEQKKGNNLTDAATDAMINQGKEQDNILDKTKKINQKLKDLKDGLKTSLGILGNMASSAGFGGVMNGVADIAGAFASGGPILGGMTVVMSFATFIFNKFLEIDKAVEDISKGIGRGGAMARQFAASSFELSRNFASYGISIEEAAGSAISLVKEFGNLDYLTQGNQQTIALMSKQLGIGSEEATKALGTFMNMKGSSLAVAKDTASFAMSVARAAGLPLPAIMQDLSQNSESAAKYGGKFANSAILASAAAKKMGLSFGDVAKIAEGILDIETSVEKQFEAQVLLGRDVNLEQARYYSLIGDTNKLQKEVLKQVGSQAQFEKMMPMQRQALADAIGIGVEQLGKMVSRQKEGMSIEEKTYNLQKEALDAQLKGSDKMIGVVKQIEGAFTELGYAVLQFFGIDIGGSYIKGAEAGANFAKMISNVASELRNGHGPLFEFLTSVKNFGENLMAGVKFIWDYKEVILILIGAFALFKVVQGAIAIMALFKGSIAATAVTTTAASPAIGGFFAALAGGLGLLWPVSPILALIVAGIVGIGAAFLGIGMAIMGIADLGLAFVAFSNINISNIDNVFSLFSSNLVKLNKNKDVIEMISKIESLAIGMGSISKFSGAAITIKSNTEIAQGQEKYYSESLKYLKIIALATTVTAEGKTKDIRLKSLDSDLAILN